MWKTRAGEYFQVREHVIEGTVKRLRQVHLGRSPSIADAIARLEPEIEADRASLARVQQRVKAGRLERGALEYWQDRVAKKVQRLEVLRKYLERETKKTKGVTSDV